MKSILYRLLHLGVMMFRRSSGGGNDIAGGEGQRFGPRGDVSPPKLEHGETLTVGLVATFLSNYDSYKTL